MDLVDGRLQESREERCVPPRRDRAALVVAEAEVRREPRPADDGHHRAVEERDEPLRILSVGVAAHRGLVDRDLLATGVGQRHELCLDDRQQRFGRLPPVSLEPARERVRPRDRHLQRRSRRRDTAQPLEFRDGAEAVGRGEPVDDAMTRALVVRRRPEQPRRGALLDSVEEPVEAEVEVEPGLLSVGDRVEPCGNLVVNGSDHGVLLQLRHVVGTEVVEVRSRVFEPAREGIAPDHGRSQRRH
jgi:hypothetical protein